MAVFLACTALEGLLPESQGRVSPRWYPPAYALKVIVVAVVAWLSRSAWIDLRPRPSPGAALLGVFSGLIVFVLWVGLDGHYPSLPLQQSRAAFDPGEISGWARPAFLAVRLAGLTLLVPLIEELFWRSFILRLVIKNDFRSVPIGRVTWPAALISSGLFALAHPEWLPALITGLLWVGLLAKTRSLAVCLLSHVAANLALGIYVLITGNWRFW